MIRVLGLALGLGACSLVFVSGPPPDHAQRPAFDCSASRFIPVLDVAWATLMTLNLAVAVKDDDTQWNDTFGGSAPFARTIGIPLYAALAAGSALGSWYGFVTSSRCIQAKRALEQRQLDRPIPRMPDAGPAPEPAEPAPDANSAPDAAPASTVDAAP